MGLGFFSDKDDVKQRESECFTLRKDDILGLLSAIFGMTYYLQQV